MSRILFILELGGFPLTLDDLKSEGHDIELVTSMRKGLASLKKTQPDIIVADFHYTSQFRDRDSNLDTLMTQIVSRSPHTQLIALVEPEERQHFERLKARFDNIHSALYFPYNDADIKLALHELIP